MVIYLDHNTIKESKITEPPRSRSITGYGKKIPTGHMLKLCNNRWYRVYAICYSNVSSYYIKIGNGWGMRFLDTDCFNVMGI